MSLRVTRTDVTPASAGILVQLPAAIAATQVKMQGLVEKTTDALEAAEGRAIKLEAELIAAKAQHAADKAVSDAQIKNLEAMNGTLQKTLSTVLQRLSILERREELVEKTLLEFIPIYNNHTHGYGPGNTEKTSRPGYSTGYRYPTGWLFTSNACPIPKFDDKKTN